MGGLGARCQWPAAAGCTAAVVALSAGQSLPRAGGGPAVQAPGPGAGTLWRRGRGRGDDLVTVICGNVGPESGVQKGASCCWSSCTSLMPVFTVAKPFLLPAAPLLNKYN